jgi:hypothetical protein
MSKLLWSRCRTRCKPVAYVIANRQTQAGLESLEILHLASNWLDQADQVLKVAWYEFGRRNEE